MKKGTIQIISIFLLIVFSFFYTDQLINIGKSKDILMQEIKEKAINYQKEAHDAIITDDTIIPGLKGVSVNVNRSYNNMKKLGVFNDKFLLFDSIMPEELLENNHDKYIIGGNPSKKAIALVFKVTNNDNLKEILSILNQTDTEATFFIDGKWAEENIEILKKIVINNQIANLGYNQEYDHITILYTNSIINKLTKQTTNYCYLESPNYEVLKICKNKKMGTILVNRISSNLYNIKANLKNGSIILLNDNEMLTIIKYIKQKGFDLVTLDKLLEE